MNLPHHFGFRKDLVHPTTFIAHNATILGNVHIGPNSSVWFGAILRGDSDTIKIGAETNIQDGAILHTDHTYPCEIGDHVSVGHGAVIHGATIERECLIGIRSVILNGAVIGTGSIIGAGTIIPEGMLVPPGSLVLGVPGKIKRTLAPEDFSKIEHAWKHYVNLSQEMREQQDYFFDQ